MERTLMILGSVTYALKAKELLFSHGISAYMERGKKTREFGCGYGLNVPKDTDKAERILKENGIKILGRISRQQKDNGGDGR